MVSSSWCCYRCHRSIGFVKVVEVVATIIRIVVAVLVVFVEVLGLAVRRTRPTVACADDDKTMVNACGVIKRFQTGFYSMVIVSTRGRRLSLAIRSHTIAIPCGVAASHSHLHVCPCAICVGFMSSDNVYNTHGWFCKWSESHVRYSRHG